MDSWLALAIGNSRLHWAAFSGDRLLHTWDTDYWAEAAIAQFAVEPTAANLPIPPEFVWRSPMPVWLASVVPEQTQRWQSYPACHILTLDDVPLTHTYPTLGVDRALALWGAIVTLRCPVLVIDAGTAMTFTAAAAGNRFLGGAILPGLRLQQQALAHDTAALPWVSLDSAASLPDRWATSTPHAIRSGILYTMLAGIQDFVGDWLAREPGGSIALTGGDAALLHHGLMQQNAALARRIHFDPALIFRGIPALRRC